MLRASGATDKGRVRQSNEDCFGIDVALRLCVVADGMGGHSAGEVASSLAVDAVTACVRTETIEAAWPFGFDAAASSAGNLLASSLHLANKQIFDLASATPEYAGMGTTVVAVIERDGLLSVAHAGDSRMYLFGRDGLCQVTNDDSWIAAVLSRDPATDPATLKQHPMRHALTNVVGSRARMTVTLKELSLADGDRILLTSDGVHGVIEHARLTEIMGGAGDLKDIAAVLIAEALDSGSRDNVTAVVAEYRQDS